MIKTIKINKAQSIELSDSVGWLFVYKEQFGHDILPDILPLIESALAAGVQVLGKGERIEVAELLDDQIITDFMINVSSFEFTTMLQIIWAMAKKANHDIGNPEAFFDEFDKVPLDQIIPVVFRMIAESMISSKNVKSLLERLKRVKASTLTSSSSQALTED